MSQTLTFKEKANLTTQRELLRVVCAGISVAARAAVTRDANSFSREGMPGQLTKQYRNRCAADPVHASTLEVAFARLDALGIEYKEIVASLRCPICGCPILSLSGELDSPRRDPPSF
jgi:hypothetical protein